MTPLETLRAARQLITDPAKWTQGDYARDADGIDVAPEDEDAVCFCSYGAIASICGLNEDLPPFRHLHNVCGRMFKMSVIDLNDTHSHAEVLALFDAAIAELEGV
jgi:hypothetical protein